MERQINCVEYIVVNYFKLPLDEFRNNYSSKYPVMLDLVKYLAGYNYFIGAGATAFGKRLTITFNAEDIPLLIIVKSSDEIDHIIVYDGGKVTDLAGQSIDFYKNKILGIYPITKIQ